MKSPRESKLPQPFFPEYRVLGKLGANLHSESFKVVRKEEPDKTLVIKRVRPAIFSENFFSYLSRQIEHLRQHDLPGVIIPAFNAPSGDSFLLVRDYFHGRNLGDWKKSRGRITLPDFFKIAASLAGILNRVHNAGCFHGDIKPNNILIGPNNLDVRLIDPVRVIDISEISRYIHDDNFKKTALPYISPEQTGRIKQQFDYPTDFYSLGIVFYELLNGTPPFASKDPLKVIHSHLAEIPRHLSKLNPDIPEMIGDIVAKLILKEPEKRYQTGSGLVHDLNRCRDEYLNREGVSSFPLGLRDYSDRISISSIMVGRDKERELLIHEHKLSCDGDFRSAMISGLPGIGKTRLIKELEMPIVSGRGYFTSGKFDQYQKNVPYDTLIQALSNLIKTFLTEDAHRVQYWKKTIESALEQNGKLITDLLPELELMIGIQPEVVDLPPTEAKNRFNDTTGCFISCLAGPDHPLTLFIDDLQWCDRATFDLIENLYINSKDHPYLFLLGAYRQNEVDQAHPLANLLGKLRKMKKPLTEILINELEPTHLKEMVANILDVFPEQTKALSEIVNAASEGNPLYANEALSWFYENRLIYPDKDGAWQWDDEKIAKSSIPKSTEELFRSKIRKIPKHTLKVLQIAACLGATFKIEDLSKFAGRDQAVLYRELAPIFSQRILLKKKGFLSFFHDRVQEAINSTLDEKTRQDIHARIAEAYIEAIPEGSALETLDNLFDIVEHLNKGRIDTSDGEILFRDAGFNYHAGRKAVGALALVAANKYFKISMGLVPGNCWEKEYDFAFSLYKELARSELTLGNQSSAEGLLNELIKKSKTDLDRAECSAEQTITLTSLGNIEEAIKTGNQGLVCFGKAISRDDGFAMEKADKLFKKIHEENRNVWQTILDLPSYTERAVQIEASIYSELLPNYYLSGSMPQFYLTAVQAVENCLKNGVNESILCFSAVAALYFDQKELFEISFKYEDLFFAMIGRYPNTISVTRGMSGILWFSIHNRHNASYIIKQSQKNISRCQNIGNLFDTGLSYAIYLWNLPIKGEDLGQIIDACNECIRFSEKFNALLSIWLARGVLSAWSDEMSIDRHPLDEKEIDTLINTWEKDGHFALIGSYYILKGVARYFLGQYSQSAFYLRKAKPYLKVIVNTTLNRIWYVFTYTSELRCHSSGSAFHKDEEFSKLTDICMEKVETWTRFGPFLKPYFFLMRLEHARCFETFSETRRRSLDAIDMAHEQGYTLLEGYIHETLGELLLEKGIDQADYHIKKAAYLYDRCHAQAKSELIRRRYPRIFSEAQEEKFDKKSPAQRLDAEYMAEASRAIYQEFDIDELLKVVMRLLMERSGANEGYLLVEKGDDLVTRVKGKKEKHISVTLTDEPLSEETGLSRAMVRYVQRTKKTLIVGNAAEDGQYSKGREVMDLKLCSVFIHPIIRQQKLAGIVCLQNNLIKAAFTEEHVEIVRQLSVHAAVAMENAVLVADMKKAEKTIRQSEELLRQSLELSRMVAWDCNFADNSIKWSGDVASLFGRSADEMPCADDFFKIIHPEDHDKVKERIQESIDTAAGYRAEYRVVVPDGSIRWLMSRGNTMHDAFGRPMNIAGMIMDITERKLAEKALRDSEGRYRGIINAAMDGIAVIDKSGTLLDANPALCEMFGYSYDEIIGIQVKNLIHPDHRHRLQYEFSAQIKKKGTVRLESPDIRKNGSLVLIEIHGVSFNHAGQGALLAIIRDITERKHAEEELARHRDHLEDLVKERTEELGRANKELNDFAYVVSHDLKAPLRGISQLTGWLADDYADVFDEDGKELMNMLIGRARRMHNMIDGVLQYSRVGRITDRVTEVDLSTLVNEIIEIISPPENTQIIIKNKLPNVYCDETAIYQVFQNFLDNAVKYMDKPDGRITIDAVSEGSDWCFCIADNGPGIEEGHRKRIFQMFQTLRPKDETESTGIGLSLVEKIVHSWGGSIRLESDVGKGSKFFFTMPKKEIKDEK